jgi:hypothetical protein
MEQRYNINDGFDELFAIADNLYDNLKRALVSTEMKKLEHGDIEERVAGDGLEILKQLVQVHFDVRAQEEVHKESVIGSDGVVRNHRRDGCKRSLETLFGNVTVTRVGYSQRDTTSLFPLDAELNLPSNKYSHGLMRRSAKESIRGSFDDAVSSIEETTGGAVPKRQLEDLAIEVAQDFEAFYSSQSDEAVEETADPLIISLDGKGIVMRQEALRGQTKKAAENEEHKLKTRLSKGEKRNRKRMAAVATVYDIEKYRRSAKSIMGLEEKSETSAISRGRNKRVWASVEREHNTVTEEAFLEALGRDPEKNRPWAVLVDGLPQQIRNIKSCIERLQLAQTIVLILDIVHVIEYLWKAAYCFHTDGSPEAEAWVKKRVLHILEGKSSDVAAGMRRSATLRRLSKKVRAPVDTCAHYLLKNREMLKYDDYLKQGLPIATGAIEGACRYLIKDRMDITGARWRLEGAEAILKLRSIKSSGDFEDYWKFYKTQSHTRIYSSQYQDLPWLQAA